MTAKDLKNALLQEAVQGKLVPQIASEGNARDLLEEIRKEKLSHGLDFANAKSGKKKSKKETALAGSNQCDIKEDEIPFDIPESWCWCRLGEIVKKITDGTHNSPTNTPYGEYKYITAKNIKETGIDLSNITYVSKDVHDEIFLRCNPELNDVLLIKDGATTGVVTVNNLSEPFSMLSSVALIKLPEVINPWFLTFVLRSDLFYKNLRSQMKGTGITRITLKQIEPTLIPLPPLAEQKRIVAAIEKFMPLIEEYGKKETELKAFNEQIGALTKKAILQEAVQGKLVPQIAAEGNAKELKEELLKSKKKLVNEKLIYKKSETKPFFDEDDYPFDIPENWTWVKLSDISIIQEGAGIRKWQYRNTGTQLLCVTNILNGKVDLNLKKLYIDTAEYNSKYKHLTVKKGDIVCSCSGGSWGKAAIYELDETIMMNTSTLRLRFFEDLGDNLYLYYVVQSDFFKNQLLGQLSGMQPNFGYAHYSRICIPLPPLAEQKRIVFAIEKMLPLCEKLGE